MTVQRFAGGTFWPERLGDTASLDENNNLTLDAASEKAAVIFQIPQDGNIVGAVFTTNAVSVTAGPLTFTVTLETVDSNGFPTGTLFHANATVTQAIATTDDNTQFEVAWTSFVGTGGTVVALVVAAPGAGTLDVDIARMRGYATTFPYTALFTASWAKVAGSGGVCALKYDDGYHYVPGVFPIETTTNTSFNNTSNPDQRGAKFQLPGPVRITGACCRVDGDADFDIILYDSGGSVQLTHSHTTNERAGTDRGAFDYMFDGSFELAANTVARIVLKPTSASDITVPQWNVSAVALMDAFQGGQNFHLTTKDGASAFVDTTTVVPHIGIIYDGIADDGGGGGGGGAKLAGLGGGLVA